MVSDYLNRVRSLEELYALMDDDRIAAAKLAEAAFQCDLNTAVTSITEISAVATAKVLADTQVASAKMLIDAEVAATRIAAGAKMALSECERRLRDPGPETSSEAIIATILDIERHHQELVSSGAKQSVEAIERDAAAAIARQEIGAAAIDNIRDLAGEIEAAVERNAQAAAEKLATYRQHPHTCEEAAAEGDVAAKIVAAAAEAAAMSLRRAAEAALGQIHAVTCDAGRTILASAKAAESRIETARDKALAQIHQAVISSLPGRPGG